MNDKVLEVINQFELGVITFDEAVNKIISFSTRDNSKGYMTVEEWSHLVKELPPDLSMGVKTKLGMAVNN
jgi:hypothetical protein